MVLAFTRLNDEQDIILRRKNKSVLCMEWRKNLVSQETFYYGNEDEAYERFENQRNGGKSGEE